MRDFKKGRGITSRGEMACAISQLGPPPRIVIYRFLADAGSIKGSPDQPSAGGASAERFADFLQGQAVLFRQRGDILIFRLFPLRAHAA